MLTGYDLNFAFWLFFGSMALVISLAGSLVALASLYLQDQRVHEERINQGKFGPIAKFSEVFNKFHCSKEKINES